VNHLFFNSIIILFHMKITTVLLICFVLFSSCLNKEEKKLEIINVYPEKSDSILLSMIAIKIEKKVLETKDSSLITSINEIESTDEFIFINDAGKRVLEFAVSGKFIRQIGSQGRGPSEFLSIYDIALDRKNKRLFLASYKKILCFSYTGELVNVIKQDAMPEFLTVVQDTLWVISTCHASVSVDNRFINITHLIRYECDGSLIDTIQIKKVFLDAPAGTIHSNPYYITNLVKSQFIYYPVMLPEQVVRDTIYSFKGDRLVPLVKLDFGSVGLSQSGKKQVYIENIYMTRRYLFSVYRYNSKQFLFCYDKLSEDSFHVTSITDDFYGSGKVRLKPLDLNNGIMYFVKEGFEITGKIEEISENSNPVIFFVKLKK